MPKILIVGRDDDHPHPGGSTRPDRTATPIVADVFGARRGKRDALGGPTARIILPRPLEGDGPRAIGGDVGHHARTVGVPGVAPGGEGIGDAGDGKRTRGLHLDIGIELGEGDVWLSQSRLTNRQK